MPAARIEQSGSDVLLWIKAVPGASRDQISGVLGDRVKVRIGAPPENGKANNAIARVIAEALNIKPTRVSIESGHSNPAKVLRIADMKIDELFRSLPLDR